MINFVKYCLAAILIVLGTAKLLQLTLTRELESQIFLDFGGVPMRWVMLPVSLAELATGLALLFAPLSVSARPLLYLAAGFSAYRIAAVVQGVKQPCDCLGGLGKLLGIGNKWLNVASWSAYAAFMVLVIILFIKWNPEERQEHP